MRTLRDLLPREIQKQYDLLPAEEIGMREEEFERKYGRVDIFNVAFRCGAPVAHVMRTLSTGSKLLWCLIAPGTYDSFLDEALEFGLMRVRRDILDAPIYDAEGNFNTKAADLLLKAVAFFDMRKNGGILNKNLHIVRNEKDLKTLTAGRSIKDIEERIRELEQKGVVDKALGIVAESNRTPSVSDAIKSLTQTPIFSDKD